MNGRLQLKWNLNLKAVVANIVKSVMEYQLEQNLPVLANKVKSVMGVSTQARSPMEVGTEMRFVMYEVPEKTKTMLESRKWDFFVQWIYWNGITMIQNGICSLNKVGTEVTYISQKHQTRWNLRLEPRLKWCAMQIEIENEICDVSGN